MKNIYPCVVGLGYVGLPLYVRLKKKFKTIGFDTDKERVRLLKKGVDINKELSKKDLKILNSSKLTNNLTEIKKCNFFIIAVPTPVKKNYLPDLKNVRDAVKLISKAVSKNDIVFLESTVFPTVTKNICIPIIEKNTKLKENVNFFMGYSSERINPGDEIHSVDKISKVVAIKSNNTSIINKVKKVYKSISNNVVISKKIEEAETSKVIENIQRDLNIALMNEIYLICKNLNIDFNEVKRLALTKWNFHNYSPGLVGGHCLPVDPYYLAYIAQKKNYSPNVLLSGRELNNKMTKYIEKKIIDLTNIRNNKKNRILIYGATYKQNVSDLRNSQPLKIFKDLREKYKKQIFCFDNRLDDKSSKKYGVHNTKLDNYYDYLIPLVKHKEFNFFLKKIKNKNKKIKVIDIWN